VTPIFEWNADKNASNQQKHGISFDEARLAFLDPFNTTLPDSEHFIEEERFVLLGFAKRHLLIVVYAERADIIRIISCRKANPRERRIYEQGNR